MIGEQLHLAGRVPWICANGVTRIQCEFHVKKPIAGRFAASKTPPTRRDAVLRKTLICSGIRNRCEAKAAAPVQFNGSSEHLRSGGFPCRANICQLAEKRAKKRQGKGRNSNKTQYPENGKGQTVPLQHCISFHFGHGASQSLREEHSAGVIRFFLHHSFATGSGNQVGPSPCAGNCCVVRLLSVVHATQAGLPESISVTQIST